MGNVVLPVLLTILGGCDATPPLRHWSLKPGDWFLYAAERATQVEVSRQRLWIRNGGEVMGVDGQPAWLREIGSGSAELLRLDPRGLSRIAWLGGAVDGRRTRALDQSLLLPLRATLDARWESPDRTRLLERKVDGYGRLFVVDEAVRIDWRVSAVDESVAVPSGRFSHCLRLEGRGSGRFKGDRSVTGSRFTVTETQWLAPAVGLVRLEREETTDGGIIPVGHYRLELIERGPD
ncbi:MAG TPA: hypothetical protein DCY89_07965 [Gammaproteobacteria bacterium]|nr:hypothetical protein [Gammaproteobacteria bacterium]